MLSSLELALALLAASVLAVVGLRTRPTSRANRKT